MNNEADIDVEKSYSKQEVVSKLRRLADALEQNKAFQISVAGERIYVPSEVTITFEYDRTEDEQELEIEFKWKRS
ncbi:MAG: amphi-Trp domain-containing protein [Desmonostoc vinosum HA7617-LM4]|jgi:amphi-Trp domain-containing protein|nr:amphi-Trp domain-containing protein [Desmonostoc vinosum HA7617-LM4]